MNKINFLYANSDYCSVLDSMVNPICKFLPEYYKINEYQEDMININFFREYKPQRGIFMSHGIADKNWRDANKVISYDYICVSGMAWKDKMIRQGFPEHKILITGYTKLDPIFNGEIIPNKGDRKKILFAPTHGTIKRVSLYKDTPDIINIIPKEFEIIISPHPAMNNNSNPTMQNLIDADVVISDCSSIIYEAWALGKPVIFLDWLVKDEIIKEFPNSFEDFIYTTRLGLHAQNPQHLISLLYFVLNNNLSIDVPVKNFIEGILPFELRGHSGENTANILLKLNN